ncbi:MAG TPA: hypothetical protein PK530_04100 [Anaerolineales bacterium]|nr:hypothetical protein [Anaerolineales bacterium]
MELLSDEEYRLFQAALTAHPDMGDIIPGGGGLRKVRWTFGRRGKSGGVRIIYYWARPKERLLMLFIFPKAERVDLPPAQLQMLRKVVEREYP